MREEVLSWLNSGANAQEGVRLMTKSGASPLTMRLIRSNPIANRQMMVEYLCRKHHIESDYSVTIQQPEVIVTAKKNTFRQEFPFLNDKKCPVELEALASRKFSKFYAYVGLHKKLRDCTSLKECAETGRALIDNYIENRMIYDELHYYQKHKSLLGKHPIFQEFARRKELLTMPIKQLVLRQQQIENNIWRVNSEIKKGNKPHLDAIRRERMAGYEVELEEVKRLLE